MFKTNIYLKFCHAYILYKYFVSKHFMKNILIKFIYLLKYHLKFGKSVENILIFILQKQVIWGNILVFAAW